MGCIAREVLPTATFGSMAKLADANVSKAFAERREGSTPSAPTNGNVAQLADATDLNPVKCGFDSLHSHYFGLVAQSVSAIDS